MKNLLLLLMFTSITANAQSRIGDAYRAGAGIPNEQTTVVVVTQVTVESDNRVKSRDELLLNARGEAIYNLKIAKENLRILNIKIPEFKRQFYAAKNPSKKSARLARKVKRLMDNKKYWEKQLEYWQARLDYCNDKLDL